MFTPTEQKSAGGASRDRAGQRRGSVITVAPSEKSESLELCTAPFCRTYHLTRIGSHGLDITINGHYMDSALSYMGWLT